MAVRGSKELVADVEKSDIVREVEAFNSQWPESHLMGLLFKGYDGISADTFLELYDFALDGDTSNLLESSDWFDDAICACALVVSVFHAFDEISGYVGGHNAIDVVHDAALGRVMIDFARLGESADVGMSGLSLRQMSILCRMKEASVRNALSKDEQAPKGFKEGKQVFFEPLEAHQWMLQRRGYRPTELPVEERIQSYTGMNLWAGAYRGVSRHPSHCRDLVVRPQRAVGI
ncbi:hypothetical protein FHR99_003284 [Litorivivens lipolytica]|uniref:Uncharacterized protein n=1 Tax=Litorivivens lipolytica TaxID=1524264 RepID=A0A7W4W7T9_9GAMM|nr:hypothetical protein [Litorivivens lipolytica]MBB3049000.1 hypothetical protein [Litorivivens lipolytica]